MCRGGSLLRWHLYPLELLDALPFELLLHVGLPDHGRSNAAGEAVQFSGVLQIVLEGLSAFRVSHPDACEQLRGVADEPRVEEVLARPALAGHRAITQVCVIRDALGDVPDHDLGRLVGDLGIYDLPALGVGRRLVEDLLSRLPFGANYAGDHGGLHQASTVGYGRVGGRHVERRDLVGAKDDRGVGVLWKVRGDAEPVGDVRDRLRAVIEPLAAGVHNQVGEHGVVRPPQGLFEADGPALDPVVVLDPPALGLVGAHVDVIDLFLGDELGLWVYALIVGRYEGVGLEGAAGLAPALGHQIELRLRIPVADHRPNAPCT